MNFTFNLFSDTNKFQSLSSKSATFGNSSLSPFLLRMIATILPAFDSGSSGSCSKVSQWWNTHCGKASPPVMERRCSENLKDSATGM